MKILVTGGAGFIGSNLVRRLIDKHEIVVVDDFSTGREENLSDLQGHPNLLVIDACITTGMSFARFEFDQIYHLACPASPPKYQADPVRTIQTCVLGAISVLEYAKPRNTRVLLASTSEVYGDPLEHPQHESYHGNVNTTGPRACYDEGKRIGETLFREYQHQYGVDTRIARIFNTYGPRMDPHDGRVITNFLRQALANEPVTVYGDGTQTRSFCYIDDMLDGLATLMAYDGQDCHTPFNLGNPVEFKISELAKHAIEITGSTSSIKHEPLPKDDPARRRPSIRKINSRTGWIPKVTLKEGLQHMLAYMQQEVVSDSAT